MEHRRKVSEMHAESTSSPKGSHPGCTLAMVPRWSGPSSMAVRLGQRYGTSSPLTIPLSECVRDVGRQGHCHNCWLSVDRTRRGRRINLACLGQQVPAASWHGNATLLTSILRAGYVRVSPIVSFSLVAMAIRQCLQNDHDQSQDKQRRLAPLRAV
jgi:hypothetical protein